MTHAPGCPAPAPALDLRGVLKCPSCRYVQPQGIGQPQVVPEVPRPEPSKAGYRCRDHHGQAVNFRGKGCPLCPKRKAKKRKATDYTEMEHRP